MLALFNVCTFYSGDLLLGPQEVRLVVVWSSLVLVLVLVLLDEFCLFCAAALFMKKTTLLSIKYGYVRIARAQRCRGKVRSENSLKCVFGKRLKLKIISLFSLFLLSFMGPTALLVLFMGPTVLFQLTFTFIYSTFSNNFSVLAK